MRNMSRSTLVCLMSIMCWLVLPNVARAQAVAIAQVSGSVTDQSGSAIPNAQVRMIETGKQSNRATVTDAQGQYVLPGLPVGAYQMEVQANGFKNYVQS